MSREDYPDDGESHRGRKAVVALVLLGAAGYAEVSLRDSKDIARWMSMDGHATDEVQTRQPFQDLEFLNPTEPSLSPPPDGRPQLDDDKETAAPLPPPPPVVVVETPAPAPSPTLIELPSPTPQPPEVVPAPEPTETIPVDDLETAETRLTDPLAIPSCEPSDNQDSNATPSAAPTTDSAGNPIDCNGQPITAASQSPESNQGESTEDED